MHILKNTLKYHIKNVLLFKFCNLTFVMISATWHWHNFLKMCRVMTLDNELSVMCGIVRSSLKVQITRRTHIISRCDDAKKKSNVVNTNRFMYRRRRERRKENELYCIPLNFPGLTWSSILDEMIMKRFSIKVILEDAWYLSSSIISLKMMTYL